MKLPSWIDVNWRESVSDSDNPHSRTFKRKCKTDTLYIAIHNEQEICAISGYGLFIGSTKDAHRAKALLEILCEDRGGWA